jgi:hypothetical protein
MTLLIETLAIRNHSQLIENKAQPQILIETFAAFFPPPSRLNPTPALSYRRHPGGEPGLKTSNRPSRY